MREAWGVPFVHMFHTLGHMKTASPSARANGPPKNASMANSKSSRPPTGSSPPPRRRSAANWLYGADMSKARVVSRRRFATVFPIPTAQAKEMVGICPEHKNIIFARPG
ncbi:MAG: hypothetical protein M5U34_00730 [Chloroflexi bacterium]|nr:hypothetical protein [Chloroflexota bacterium]